MLVALLYSAPSVSKLEYQHWAFPGLGLGGKTHSLDVIICVTPAAPDVSPGDALFTWGVPVRKNSGGLSVEGGVLAMAIGDGAKLCSLGAILGPFDVMFIQINAKTL